MSTKNEPAIDKACRHFRGLLVALANDAPMRRHTRGLMRAVGAALGEEPDEQEERT